MGAEEHKEEAVALDQGAARRNVIKIIERSARAQEDEVSLRAVAEDRPSASVERTPRAIAVGVAAVLVGGALWGANGSVSKILMEGYGITPLWLACVRELGAGVLFLLCAAVRSPDALRAACASVREWPRYVWTALTCVTLVQVAYLFSIRWTNAGTATVLQTVSLLMVLAYVCVRGRRHPSTREVVGVAMAFIGVWLIATGGHVTSLALPLPGLLWGLTDAFSCACLAIIPVALIAKYGNFVVNGITFLLSGIILLPFVRPWESAPSLDARGWGLLAFTVVMGTFVAFWLYMAGVMRVGPMRATMLGTIEPVMATITAVAWTGAVFVAADLLGFALIILMSFLVR
ncbi:MAG: EamA family transporter [Bifidobacterium sp.]|nr:EamA family transporter [Bifidobacterium sp.]